ncbi:sugar ABC transporter substrate-binding protein [Herbaspirillum sp. RTI4]|uniref:ABC transporter substrate-binding protein n=1 Tax=Herbaspirillum sp. RTI4 TaxID=3048640 RepID=UPI002AB42CB1|nr:sugar ABC transporter substrate-binding protein [Herbaspirillum sp. RTI4]MDY7578775.1 sugar ABC transporter substrate-binding protein [Herbaspirillum sp. RTI4]MEA9982305.1 sugar ABC transporter substrate-binding protein [Herbaspirillum sp. RTI4]
MKLNLLKVSLLAAAAILACSSSLSHADNEYKGQTLRIKLIGGEQYETLYSIIPEWEKKTGAKVDILSRKSHFEFDRELKQDIAARKIDYCVASNHTNFAAQYPIFRDLNGMFPVAFIQKFSAPVIKHSTIDGKLLEIPRHSDVSALYYNKLVYNDPQNKKAYKAKFGKELAPPQTWIEATQQAKFFSKPPKFYGTQFPGKDEAITGRFYEMLVADGGTLFDKNWNPTFNSEAGIRALNWFVDIYKAGAVPKGSPNYVWDDLGNGFASGNIAFDLDWSGWSQFFNDPKSSRIAGNVGVTRAPKGSAGVRTGWSGSHGFSITQKCENPKMAADFIMYMTSFDAQMLEAHKGLIPTRIDVQAAIQKEFEEKNKYMGEVFKVFSTAMAEDAFTPPKIAEWNELSNILWPELQKAIIGDKTAKQALDDASKKATVMMKENGMLK